MSIPAFFKNNKKILLLVLVLIAGVSLLKIYQHFKYQFVNNKVEAKVDEKSDGLYSITYDSISINELAGNLYVTNLHITADTSLQLQYIKDKDKRAGSVLLDITIPMLEITGLKTPAALLSKKLIAETVTIQKPVVKVFFFPGITNEQDTAKSHEQFYKQLLGNLTQVKADNIQVNDAEIIGTNFYNGAVKFKAHNTSIAFTGVAVDSSTIANYNKTFFSERVQITSDKILLGDKDNTANASHVQFDTDVNSIKIASFSYDAFKKGDLFKTEINDINLAGFSWTGQPDQSTLKIGLASIGHTLLQFSKKNPKEAKSEEKIILNGWIKKFSLAELKIKETDIVEINSQNKPGGIKINSKHLNIKNITLDTTATFGKGLATHLSKLQVENGITTFTKSGDLYKYKIAGLLFGAEKNYFQIAQMEILPLLSEADFAAQAGVQKDRFHASFKNIKARQFNFSSLLSGEVSIKELSASGNTIKITRDTRYPLDSVSKVGKYPHQVLMNLSFPLSIKTVLLAKTNIEYKEISEQTNEAGIVQFTNSEFEIKNVKNRKISPGDSIAVNFSTVFIKEIPLKGSFVFYLDDIKKGLFGASGNTLKPFNIKVVNKLIQPLSAARFDKGTIHHLAFTLKGDNYQSQGDVAMTYDNLKVSLLKKKDNEYKKKDFLSLVANLVVVDKSNLNKKSDKQHAAATNKRDVYRSFFNHLWKTIMNGAQKIIT